MSDPCCVGSTYLKEETKETTFYCKTSLFFYQWCSKQLTMRYDVKKISSVHTLIRQIYWLKIDFHFKFAALPLQFNLSIDPILFQGSFLFWISSEIHFIISQGMISDQLLMSPRCHPLTIDHINGKTHDASKFWLSASQSKKNFKKFPKNLRKRAPLR